MANTRYTRKVNHEKRDRLDAELCPVCERRYVVARRHQCPKREQRS